jgi:hypothetical protein
MWAETLDEIIVPLPHLIKTTTVPALCAQLDHRTTLHTCLQTVAFRPQSGIMFDEDV